ncbi:MAG: DinB family protein [Bacteroidetes bacterium]|nr:DinB family protein [Bacteroidota bacterium]
MNRDDLLELFEYNQWAKVRLLDSLAQVKQEDFSKDLHSSHGGIQGTLFHMVNAENIWLSRLEGNQVTPLDASQLKSVEDFRKAWDDLDKRMTGVLAGVNDSQLQAMMGYQDSRGNKYRHPKQWAFNQIFNHFTYHRGQIVALQRELGYQPVNTDLIGFYRERRS